MTRRLLVALLCCLLIAPSVGLASRPSTNPVQALQHNGQTFCTTFSINEAEGNYATARHCADFAAELWKQTGQPVTIGGYPAWIVFVDIWHDVAVFQSAFKAPALRLAKRAPAVRDFVEIRGFPYGLPFTITQGILAARQIPLEHPTLERVVLNDVYTAAVAGGNSGSPVLNGAGDVVGVLWGSFNQSGHSIGVPYEATIRALADFAST